MKRVQLAVAAIAAACPAVYAQSPTSAVMITFDQSVLAPNEVCDGSISVSDGEVLALTPVLFDQGDTVDAATWVCRAPGTLDDPGGRGVVRVLKRSKAVVVTLNTSPAASVTVACAVGNATVELSELEFGRPKALLEGKLTIEPAPVAEILTGAETEDDYPSIAATASGDIWVAWQAYDNTNDVVMARRRTTEGWQEAEELTPRGDYHRPRLAATGDTVWVVWAENYDGNWELVARKWDGGWSEPVRLTDHPLNDAQHNLTVDGRGRLWVAWQMDTGKSHDIRAGRVTESGLKGIVKVTDSEANDWEPMIAPAPGGGVQVAWDLYHRSSYDTRTCTLVGGDVSRGWRLGQSTGYDAHSTVTYDLEGRLWAAWDWAGPDWGKHKVLHRERGLALICRDGNATHLPVELPQVAIPEALSGHRELPHLAVDGGGRLWLIFRHLVDVKRFTVRTGERQGQSRGIWNLYAMCYAGGEWSAPVLLPSSNGRNDMRVATCLAPDGTLWAAWAGDARNIIRAEVPGNHDIFVAPISAGTDPVRLEVGPGLPQASLGAPAADPQREPVNVTVAGADYELLYGDTHRHTDMSRCGMNTDGSIQDTYRYAIDVAKIDFLGISDHDQDILKHRYDRDERPLQSFMWWRSEKLVDIFHAGPRFTAIYGFEHGGGYKNRGGHQNIMYTERGNPCIEVDAPADVWSQLEGRNAVMIPHQLADGGSATDWERYNIGWMPVAEMFQARGSYEYMGTPRMATVQREGHYIWDALAKGLRVGVIASSDHGLTHGAYAGVYATDRTREAILDAMRARRTFGATDTIALDFRVGEHMMGEEVEVEGDPTFRVRITGTDALRRIDIISEGQFVYTRTREPGAPEDEFEVMLELPEGETRYYYLRCIQANDEMAWSSPIWVTRRAA